MLKEKIQIWIKKQPMKLKCKFKVKKSNKNELRSTIIDL